MKKSLMVFMAALLIAFCLAACGQVSSGKTEEQATNTPEITVKETAKPAKTAVPEIPEVQKQPESTVAGQPNGSTSTLFPAAQQSSQGTQTISATGQNTPTSGQVSSANTAQSNSTVSSQPTVAGTASPAPSSNSSTGAPISTPSTGTVSESKGETEQTETEGIPNEELTSGYYPQTEPIVMPEREF